MSKQPSLWTYKALAALSVLAGGGGMFLSMLHMACADMQDIIAGGAGFIAGSGIVALAVLSVATALVARDPDPSPPEYES